MQASIHHHRSVVRNNMNARLTRPRPIVKTMYSPQGAEIIHTSYVVGKAITLGVCVYCGLQWNYYRNLRKQIEDDEK